MAISMVRKPSETPNINNIDDIIPFRYAYGNQNGYVINRGSEISHTVNGNQFIINSGRLVIQGVESDIDSNGITLTIDSVSETRYYIVYHEINLATNTANIKVQFDTATYPTINEGDDLTQNSSGIATLILYKFIAQNGIINNVEKIVNSIKYINNNTIIENSKNAFTINGIEIKKDNNGVLKIGDIIIPQKKIIWNGKLTPENNSFNLNFNFNESILNKHIRIQLNLARCGNIYLDFIAKSDDVSGEFHFEDSYVSSGTYYTVIFYWAWDENNKKLYTEAYYTLSGSKIPVSYTAYEICEIVE